MTDDSANKFNAAQAAGSKAISVVVLISQLVREYHHYQLIKVLPWYAVPEIQYTRYSSSKFGVDLVFCLTILRALRLHPIPPMKPIPVPQSAIVVGTI